MDGIGDFREHEALHRYGVVRALADERLTKSERGEAVRAAARALHPHHLAGELLTHGRSTIDRRVRAWRAGGFEALKPKARGAGPLTDPVILARAVALRREEPARTGAQDRRDPERGPRGRGALRAPTSRTMRREW